MNNIESKSIEQEYTFLHFPKDKRIRDEVRIGKKQTLRRQCKKRQKRQSRIRKKLNQEK